MKMQIKRTRYHHTPIRMARIRERVISYDIAYMWNLKKKMIQINLFTKQKQTHRLKRTNLWLPGDKGKGGIYWETGIDIYTLL